MARATRRGELVEVKGVAKARVRKEEEKVASTLLPLTGALFALPTTMLTRDAPGIAQTTLHMFVLAASGLIPHITVEAIVPLQCCRRHREEVREANRERRSRWGRIRLLTLLTCPSNQLMHIPILRLQIYPELVFNEVLVPLCMDLRHFIYFQGKRENLTLAHCCGTEAGRCWKWTFSETRLTILLWKRFR